MYLPSVFASDFLNTQLLYLYKRILSTLTQKLHFPVFISIFHELFIFLPLSMSVNICVFFSEIRPWSRCEKIVHLILIDAIGCLNIFYLIKIYDQLCDSRLYSENKLLCLFKSVGYKAMVICKTCQWCWFLWYLLPMDFIQCWIVIT